MTLDEFVSTYLGTKVDYDGEFGGQCVDLFRQYVKDVLVIVPQTPALRGAYNIWSAYPKDYFTKIENTPTGVPQKGDIVIWSNKAGGGFGHVAICLEGNINSFTSLDQNWPTISKVTKTSHNYNHVLGWLRQRFVCMA